MLIENARLKKEIKELKGKRQRDRSRSPVTAAATHQVLNLLCKMDRDPVIQEQRETIVRQQKEIQALRQGEGPIGEVLLAIKQKHSPHLMNDFYLRNLKNVKTPVSQVIQKIERLADAMTGVTNWGFSFWEGRFEGFPFEDRR